MHNNVLHASRADFYIIMNTDIPNILNMSDKNHLLSKFIKRYQITTNTFIKANKTGFMDLNLIKYNV